MTLAIKSTSGEGASDYLRHIIDAREARKVVSDLAHFYSRRQTLLSTKMLKNLQWKSAQMLGSRKQNQTK